MNIAYLDSSAIVKLYVDEAHSRDVMEWFRALDKALCHAIGYVEVRAALAAAHRAGRLEESAYRSIVVDFRSDWASYSQVRLDDALMERAATMAEEFALRGYDSVHLACAAHVHSAIPDLCFVSFDKALNRAARLLGFRLPLFASTDGCSPLP